MERSAPRRARRRAAVLPAAAGVLLAATSVAQEGLDSRTSVGERGGRAGVGVGKGAAPAPVTVTHLKLSPIREWHSDDGRAIHAELMSWPIEGAAAVHGKVEELDFDVVREGRIRLRREDRIFAVPLSRLSEEDRKFVAELVERIGRKDEARSGAGDAGEGGKGDREPAESAPAADESAAPPDNSAD